MLISFDLAACVWISSTGKDTYTLIRVRFQNYSSCGANPLLFMRYFAFLFVFVGLLLWVVVAVAIYRPHLTGQLQVCIITCISFLMWSAASVRPGLVGGIACEKLKLYLLSKFPQVLHCVCIFYLRSFCLHLYFASRRLQHHVGIKKCNRWCTTVVWYEWETTCSKLNSSSRGHACKEMEQVDER